VAADRLASLVSTLNAWRGVDSTSGVSTTAGSPSQWFQFRYRDGSTRTVSVTLDQIPVVVTDGHQFRHDDSDDGAMSSLPSAFDN